MIGTTVYAVTSIHRGGHVEISPNALAHVGKKTAPPVQPKETHTKAAYTQASSLVAMRPWLGGTHDPKELLARGRHMRSIGLDITVVEVPLAWSLVRYGTRDLWPQESLPVYGYGHHVDAFEIQQMSPESVLRVVGLANGDELLGIDGYRFDDDSFRDIDPVAIQKRGWTVVEIARAEHHVVLSIKWDR